MASDPGEANHRKASSRVNANETPSAKEACIETPWATSTRHLRGPIRWKLICTDQSAAIRVMPSACSRFQPVALEDSGPLHRHPASVAAVFRFESLSLQSFQVEGCLRFSVFGEPGAPNRLPPKYSPNSTNSHSWSAGLQNHYVSNIHLSLRKESAPDQRQTSKTVPSLSSGRVTCARSA